MAYMRFSNVFCDIIDMLKDYSKGGRLPRTGLKVMSPATTKYRV